MHCFVNRCIALSTDDKMIYNSWLLCFMNLQKQKCVPLEDLAAEFKLRTQNCMYHITGRYGEIIWCHE